jgi:glutaconate CoA-transferase subunit A
VEFDQLIGAGNVRKICGAWIGNVAAGLGHNYRRAVEDEIPTSLEVENHSNFTVALGLKAAAMGLPFLPTRTLMGSDFRAEPQFSPIVCPFTGRTLLAVRELRPDVTIVHVQRADAEGNAHVWGNLGVIQDAVMAARKVVLTCEEIVSHEVVLSDPNRTLIPGFLVAAVVHVPFGSHPSPTKPISTTIDDRATGKVFARGWTNGYSVLTDTRGISGSSVPIGSRN